MAVSNQAIPSSQISGEKNIEESCIEAFFHLNITSFFLLLPVLFQITKTIKSFIAV